MGAGVFNTIQKFSVATKIGLALGGGGAKGIAHVGVLRNFEEKGISISYISGTSVGALVASLFAFGKSSKEIETIIKELSFGKISNFIPGRLGLSSNQGVLDLLGRELGKVRIEDAKIPLAIVCTDLISGKKVVYTEGPLDIIVQASTSFPGVFAPVPHQDKILIDGSITENVPLSAAKDLGANFIVGVSLSVPGKSRSSIDNVFDVFNRCFDILIDHIQSESEIADYMMHIELSHMNRFKLTEPDRAIYLGYLEAQRFLQRPVLYWVCKPWIEFTQHLILTLVEVLKSFSQFRPHTRPIFFSMQSAWKKIKDSIMGSFRKS